MSMRLWEAKVPVFQILEIPIGSKQEGYFINIKSFYPVYFMPMQQLKSHFSGCALLGTLQGSDP